MGFGTRFPTAECERLLFGEKPVTAEYSNCAPDPKAAGKLIAKVFCTLLVMTWVCGARQIGAQAASTTSGLQLLTTPASSPLRSFLNRGVWPGYYNFGKTSFQPQTNSVRSTELYDRLGTHLLRGYPLLSWRETRSDSVGLQSSTVTRENYFFNFFNNLMIANDTYRGWDLSVTAGDAIRTSLSPLTVRSPRWQGLRIDGGTGGDQGFTALLTRGAPQRFSAFDARRDLSPVLSYGGHYFHRLNDMLTLGLTFFNQHQTDVESGQGSFISGSQPYQMRSPKQVSIWVESDDPNTVAGVRDIDVDLVIIDDDGTRRRLTSDADAGGDRAGAWTRPRSRVTGERRLPGDGQPGRRVPLQPTRRCAHRQRQVPRRRDGGLPHLRAPGA